MNKQSEALIDELKGPRTDQYDTPAKANAYLIGLCHDAHMELRRLQYEVDAIPAIKEERDELQAEVKATERQVEILSDALAESRKINAELLEALNLITEVGDRAATEIARAAIAKHGSST